MMPYASQDCISYFKRFRMELDLDRLPSVPPPPEGYFLVPWQTDLLKEHTEVLLSSFQETIDSLVFPSLSDQSGCFFLMSEIVRKPGFLPGATLLLACSEGCIGSVQGLSVPGKTGAIQNLGITPAYRGQGLGTYL
jgi:hypothetical protein